MDLVAFKLALTPLLIGGASLVVRRWGQGMGGWVVGLPLNAGPVAFFIALEHGTGASAAAARGSIAGAIAEAFFCTTYSWLAYGRRWPSVFLGGTVAFGIGATFFQGIAIGPAAGTLAAFFAFALALRIMPQPGGVARGALLPRWDIPARMAVATAVVLTLTSLATVLGPSLSGTLASFPISAGVLVTFAHHQEGPGAAVSVLRGLLVGLYSYVSFFLGLASLIERSGIAIAFPAAIATALLVQACSLWVIRRRRRIDG